ncbi:MAG: M48 family metallopeptidase [Sphingomonas bacterium]|nr:M48 family metallopeptidase [Sphingomonas bacterium]
MLASWNGTLSTDRSKGIATDGAALDHPGLPWPIAIRHHPRARRMRLRLDPDNRRLLLTCPPRSSRKAAIDWAVDQRPWVESELAKLPPGNPFAPGEHIPLEGVEVLLERLPGQSRIVHHDDGNRLVCGGPPDGFGQRIEAWLKRRARDLLSAETAEIARRAGVTVRGVSIGDASSRWGSCSESGAIRYNWRLILAPPDVRRWVVAHEVAHRVHMNHGAAFKALEAALFDGDVDSARSALRLVGPRLKRVGRGL